jgi:hypothetical protein
MRGCRSTWAKATASAACSLTSGAQISVESLTPFDDELSLPRGRLGSPVSSREIQLGQPSSPVGRAETLRRKTCLLLPELLAAGQELMDHPRIGDLYPEYLFATHCIIRASVPLMEAALERTESMAGSDPVAAGLAEYLRRHIPEEKEHDEWLLDDLEVLDRARSTVLARPPSPTVAELVGAQYYWIFHYHPVALLGYVALLEGNPPSLSMIEDLIASTGYSRRAFRTLIAHAELDPHHRDELNETLDSLPLTREQTTVLGLSAMSSAHMLSRVIDEIVNVSGQADCG